MAVLGYVCAVVLAAVFVWAAAAKLARPRQTAAGFEAMGLGGGRTLAVAVPVMELILAVALVAAPRVGGLASLGVLAVFSAVLVRALRAGVTGGCACFGAAPARPLSSRSLVRNGLLACLALAAVFAHPP